MDFSTPGLIVVLDCHPTPAPGRMQDDAVECENRATLRGIMPVIREALGANPRGSDIHSEKSGVLPIIRTVISNVFTGGRRAF